MSDTSTEVTVVERPMELSVMEVRAQVQKVQELMRNLMKEGEHYGKSFPGDTRKNLLKPGADKLCFVFRLRADYDQEFKELGGGHREVLTRCAVYHIESGNKVAEGIGLATTMESKYRWRNASLKCPECGKEAIIKGKEEYGGGFICYAKKGGCGAKFSNNDPAIANQKLGKVENPDIADVYNTVIKISKKRAYMDAIVSATAASDIFSEDAEDEDFEGSGDTAQALAGEAAREEKRGETAKGQSGERKNILAAIGEVLQTRDKDGLPYFTDDEIARERETAKGMGEQRLLKQHERLKKQLGERRGEEEPAIYD
jgi:hypothetical protein